MNLSDEIVVIFAGGEGRRMGFADKGLLLIDGERLIDRLVRQVSVVTTNIIISSKHGYELSLPFVPDIENGIKGPVGGLYAVLEWMKKHRPFAKGFFTVPVDCPSLPEDIFKRLYDPNKSCVACDDIGRLEDLIALQGDLDSQSSISLHRVTKLTQAGCVEWGGQEHFININTPEQLLGCQK